MATAKNDVVIVAKLQRHRQYFFKDGITGETLRFERDKPLEITEDIEDQLLDLTDTVVDTEGYTHEKEIFDIFEMPRSEYDKVVKPVTKVKRQRRKVASADELASPRTKLRQRRRKSA